MLRSNIDIEDLKWPSSTWDCKYCDYKVMCGNAEIVSRYKKEKQNKLIKYKEKYKYENSYNLKLNLNNKRIKKSILRKVYDLENLRNQTVIIKKNLIDRIL